MRQRYFCSWPHTTYASFTGIVVGQVRPTHSVQEVYAALASGLGLHLEPGVDYQGLVMDALWWVTKLTRHVPTVVLDMCDVEAESAPAVHEVWRAGACVGV